ncbi:MAG: CsbD family protein [Actinomycetia bacterium]|nr:CsbD family protein [Actinomycetes bacterium]
MSGINRAKNKSQKLAGMAREAIGKATGDKSTENRGKRDQAMANLKDAGEMVKDAGGKLKEEAGEKVKDAGEKVANIFKK